MALDDLRMCVACKFYEPLSQANTGQCRRHPPTVCTYTHYEQLQYAGVWPNVDAGDWCGEFSLKSNLRPKDLPDPRHVEK